MAVAKEYQDDFKSIKESIEQAYQYFEPNYKTFNYFTDFVLRSTLSETERRILASLGKPQIECPILEAYILRLLGEFTSQVPSVSVRASDGVKTKDLTQELVDKINFVESHFKAILAKADNDNLENKLFKDLLIGGFSVAEVYTDYINEMSFDQKIIADRVFDPTMCGFDPLARKSHKGDGHYCFQLFPTRKKEAKKKYPSLKLDELSYTRELGNFSWSYNDTKDDYLVLCEFFQKKTKKVKIVTLSNDKVITQKKYDADLITWQATSQFELPPQILNSRVTEITTICRYLLCGTEVIEYNETDYKYLPLIFIDGNSAMIREGSGGNMQQITRPLVYHAKDIQKVKNFTFQTLANEIENMQMSQWLVPSDAIDPRYQDAWKKPQQASVLFYNAYGKNQEQLPSPREVNRIPTPQVVGQMFESMDKMSQMVLGSYDSSLGINNNQLSGEAIKQGAMQSNATSKSYLTGYINGWNRILTIILDLMPKYYVNARSLPIIDEKGKKGYQDINQDGGINLDYNSSMMEVNVEAGVNFEIQKQMALSQITKLMQASPTFASLINQHGLGVLLDNLDIRGVEELKLMAEQFMQEQQQAQQQAQQMAMQTNPVILDYQARMAAIQQKAQEAQLEQVSKASSNAINERKTDIEYIKTMADIGHEATAKELEQQKIDAENARTAVTVATDIAKHQSKIN